MTRDSPEPYDPLTRALSEAGIPWQHGYGGPIARGFVIEPDIHAQGFRILPVGEWPLTPDGTYPDYHAEFPDLDSLIYVLRYLPEPHP